MECEQYVTIVGESASVAQSYFYGLLDDQMNTPIFLSTFAAVFKAERTVFPITGR
ncbi:hypothetical protein COMA1_40121 [Candidatus Nitrospira nitrosa]|uniref:Uncharacterized protein n=1 Tax=Candidatus Nitrospira nitrosa TaxID=1742972 RepID=A0A0S4LLE8_9BACT|nr:hypothetical protein COMA1_40121 [Candidatus Nitrospira nitrosa]